LLGLRPQEERAEHDNQQGDDKGIAHQYLFTSEGFWYRVSKMLLWLALIITAIGFIGSLYFELRDPKD
jgi:hypothetical protein